MFIERDRIPDRTERDEFGRPLPDDFDWRFIPLQIAFIAAFWGMYALIGLGATAVYRALFLHVHGIPVYLGLGIAASCFLLAAVVCTFRDIRNWRSVAWLQIFISVVGGVASLVGSDFSVSGMLGFAAAVFSGANGFKKLYEISAAELKMAQK